MKLQTIDLKDGVTAFDLYPVFKTFKECKQRVGNIEPATLLHYVLLVYSKESHLSLTKDLQKQKEEAAKILGWKKVKKGEYPETVQRILDGREPVVNQMIYIVFVLQNDLAWAGYKADQSTYMQLIKELNSPLDDDVEIDKKLKSVEYKLKLSDGKEVLLKRINEAHLSFFNQDKELEQIIKENDLAESDFGEGIVERMAREAAAKGKK